MKRTLLALTIGIALAFTAVAAATTRPAAWRIVRASTASGVSASTDLDVTVRHFNQLAVRATGKVTANAFGWVCVRGTNIQSDTREVDKPGLFILTRVKGAAHCEVNASISGDGRIRLQILKR